VAEMAWHAERIVPGETGANQLHEYARDERACPLGEGTAEGTEAGNGRELLDAFWRALDLSEHQLTPSEYLDSAIGFLAFLPASFTPPAELVLQPAKAAGASRATDLWGLLRRFWSEHYDQWQAHPHKLAVLSSAANPLVVELGRHISALPPSDVKPGRPPGKPPDEPSDEPGLPGPFDSLAVEMPTWLVFSPKPSVSEAWHVRIWRYLLSWFGK